MYACIHETDSGFFAGVCEREVGHLHFATHPRPLIRELALRDAVATVIGAAIISSIPFAGPAV
jgi:hypothetical protein